ncbi:MULTISPECIES: SMI1/KNR4 family protein [unclassified Streptomyces]|uniref:SMI1/KNR4 family protein n=1 Tax=unclassified Streptomyces TaxID=2593676 RepID=UPI000D1B6F78|nr:SMI1/KNR4 family protein [Streptomyces sp. TSRI0281]
MCELEAQLRVPLPAEYRAWLGRTNGAEFPLDAVLSEFEYHVEDDLYGCRTGGNVHTELLYAHAFGRGDLSWDYLPIMRLFTGAILIKVTEPGLGSIWHRGESDFTEDGVYLPDTPPADGPEGVADTFTAFLGMWRTDEDSPDPDPLPAP